MELYFKDEANNVHVIEAGFEHLLGRNSPELLFSQITKEEADALTAPPAPTPEQIQAALVSAVQAHLDATAATLGYDNIYTAVSYADEPAVPKYQTEGAALRAWRSLVWAHCNQVLADIMAASRAVPTAAELLAELPPFVA